jgi:hypothetical protein
MTWDCFFELPFWICVVLSTGMCLLPMWAYKTWNIEINPSMADLLRRFYAAEDRKEKIVKSKELK